MDKGNGMSVDCMCTSRGKMHLESNNEHID
jgi:hypothetical protein